MSPVERSLMVLREDAIQRGLQELAITYGWSLIEMGADRIKTRAAEILNERHQDR